VKPKLITHENPLGDTDFWNWPNLYTLSEKNYPQLYAVANIKVDDNNYPNQHVRIYWYETKSEFRFQCEPVKRQAKQGDIILISRTANRLEYNIELIRQNTPQHTAIEPLLTKRISKLKHFGFFSDIGKLI
jgi:hypothetical protein